MPIILKNLNGHRKAEFISIDDAEAMVGDGTAMQDKVHAGIYEEVTAEERDQGYLTRNMMPLPAIKKRQQRKSRAGNDNGEEEKASD